MKTAVKVLIWVGTFVVTVIVEMIADGIFQAIFPGYRMGWLLRFAFFGLMLFIGKNFPNAGNCIAVEWILTPLMAKPLLKVKPEENT